MTEREIYEAAREAFNEYAASGETDRSLALSQLQVQLAKWQSRNFGAPDPSHLGLGINEELGEATEAFLKLMAAAGRVSKAVLKGEQRIRGYEQEEKQRVAIMDGVFDMWIFSLQLLTTYRIDAATGLLLTANEVMKRDWTKNRTDGGGQ